MLKIATWNINSVRLRHGLIQKMTAAHAPDILCLQETKVEDIGFPLEALKNLGYPHIAFSGEKSYNGVAILSRVPLHDIKTERFVNDHKRHISAVLPDGTELHNFYIPAGGDEPDPKTNPKFAHKLQFVEEMERWFQKHRKKNDALIALGDFNIAPFEHDVWSHRQLLSVVSHTPAEVERLNSLRDSLGWIDTSRHFVPGEQKLYSWWSYRNRDWLKSDRGRRLDHIWVTQPLKPRLAGSKILKEIRGWDTPSDHVPVMLELR